MDQKLSSSPQRLKRFGSTFIFLSQISDSVAAGVGAVLPVIHLTGTLYFPLGQGCSAVLGQALGAKQFENIGVIHGVSIVLAVCLGVLLFVVTLFSHYQISTLLGLEGELAVHASQYLQIISLSGRRKKFVLLYTLL